MDDEDRVDFERLDDGIRDAQRQWALLARLLPTAPDLTKLKTHWLDDAWEALDAVIHALESGQNLILRTHPPTKRGRTARQAARNAPSRVRAPRAELPADPSSIPGAVRIVLGQHEKGLDMAALVDAVNEVRPKTAQPLISSAVHHMRKRGEIAREGFGRNFSYRLVPPKAPEPREES